jgi:hypothetical protein
MVSHARITDGTDNKKPSMGALVIESLMEDPEFIPLMKAAIKEGLTAKFKTVPDMRVRLEAFKLAMAYGEGLPLQRIMQAYVVNNSTDMVKALQESPALAESVKRAIANAEYIKRDRRSKEPEPVFDAEFTVPGA